MPAALADDDPTDLATAHDSDMRSACVRPDVIATTRQDGFSGLQQPFSSNLRIVFTRVENRHDAFFLPAATGVER